MSISIIFGKVSGKKFERKRRQLLFLEKKPKLGQGEGGGKPAGDLSNFLSMFNIKQINWLQIFHKSYIFYPFPRLCTTSWSLSSSTQSSTNLTRLSIVKSKSKDSGLFFCFLLYSSALGAESSLTNSFSFLFKSYVHTINLLLSLFLYYRKNYLNSFMGCVSLWDES